LFAWLWLWAMRLTNRESKWRWVFMDRNDVPTVLYYLGENRIIQIEN
jgi:hypothetical protein